MDAEKKKNDSIIYFYILANRLKQKIRTGWKELEISSERLESVAEHVYGCLMLAIAIDSEYELNLDMYKTLKMLALHELEETIMDDYTVRATISKEEREKLGKECIAKATAGLIKQTELTDLLNEFNERKTKEAIFSYRVDKIECNFQAKIYDLQGFFPIESAIEDLKYYAKDYSPTITESTSASDIGIEYDKRLFKDDQLFANLIENIQTIQTLQ